MSSDGSSETPIDVGVLTFDWGREFKEARRKGRLDADRKPIPDEGPLRVFLGHDTECRQAPPDWVRVLTGHDVYQEMLGARVVEISVDNDTHGHEQEGVGAGRDVVRFIHFMLSAHKLLVWPRDGLTVYSTSPADRAEIQETLDKLGELGGVDSFDTLGDPIKSLYGYRPKAGRERPEE